jgi:hypothetical protein
LAVRREVGALPRNVVAVSRRPRWSRLYGCRSDRNAGP